MPHNPKGFVAVIVLAALATLIHLVPPQLTILTSAVVLLTPWLVLSIRARRRRSLMMSTFGWIAVVSGGALLLTDSTLDMLLEWPAILLPVAITTLLVITLTRFVLITQDTRRAFLGLAMVIYSTAAIRALNAKLDASPAQPQAVRVLSKYEARGRYLRLAAWGPRSSASNFSVGPEDYERIQSGDSVCFLLHSGALRIPWYEVATCAQ
jgi:hypothetical protein